MKKILLISLLFTMVLISCQTDDESARGNRQLDDPDYYNETDVKEYPDNQVFREGDMISGVIGGRRKLYPILGPYNSPYNKDVFACPVSIMPENEKYMIEDIEYGEDFRDRADIINYEKYFPWTIQGSIENGLIHFDFPDDALTLDSSYENKYNGDARIAGVVITTCTFYDSSAYDNSMYYYSDDFCLCRYNGKDERRSFVYIFYANEDFDKFNNGEVHLKAGWNFIELIGVYSKFDAVSDGDYIKIGLVTQDINDIYELGYRWVRF